MFRSFAVGLLFITVNTHAATLTVPSTIAQGEIAMGTTNPGATISINGDKVPVTKDGTFLLAAGRDDNGELSITAVDVDNPDPTLQLTKAVPITKATWKIENIKGLAKKYVAPPASVTKRIQSDNRRLGKVRKIVDPTPYFISGFVNPVKNARISGVFGSQRVLNGTPKSPHRGTDFAAPTGTPIVAPAPGKVTMIVDDMYYTGGTMIVDHGHGLSTVYAHMNSIDVVDGQEVAQGEQLGTVGKSGRATGPHLHFGATLRGVHIDPVYLFDL